MLRTLCHTMPGDHRRMWLTYFRARKAPRKKTKKKQNSMPSQPHIEIPDSE